MCGIAGFTGFEDKELIKRMSNIVSHRGPDDWGYFIDRNVCLGHRRLSIIDLSKKGRQPMSNENGDVWITYNGEIYNFREIRKTLEEKGHRFKSNTDTEAIVHAYEEYGEDCVKLFNGMFAFAIWDSRSKDKKLFLARDRLGIKPLHYAHIDREFIFASEIKSILLYDKIERQLNRQALNNFLTMNYNLGEETFFNGIKRLPQAHTLAYYPETNIMEIKKYWDIKPDHTNYTNYTNLSADFYAAKIRELFRTAVERRMMSDVPFGAFLSGGIDSSSIVAYMSKLHNQPLKTFSVAFNEPWDETKDARRIAEHFGTHHYEITVESDALKYFPKCIWHMDCPKKNITPTYLLSRLTRQAGVTVVEGGLGGDELFAGYRRHKYAYYRNHIAALMPGFAREICGRLGKDIPPTNELKRLFAYVHSLKNWKSNYVITAPKLIYNSDKKVLFTQKLIEGIEPAVENKIIFDKRYDYFTNFLLFENKYYLADDLLEIQDRQNMAFGIEGRVPFLDHELVEFAFTIPNSLKIHNGTTKYILRKAMQNVLPRFVFKKKKQGFNMNTFYWYKNCLKDYAKLILDEKTIRQRGLFNYGYIQKIFDMGLDPKNAYYYNQIWNLMAFEVFYRIYFEDENPNSSLEAFSR